MDIFDIGISKLNFGFSYLLKFILILKLLLFTLFTLFIFISFISFIFWLSLTIISPLFLFIFSVSFIFSLFMLLLFSSMSVMLLVNECSLLLYTLLKYSFLLFRFDLPCDLFLCIMYDSERINCSLSSSYFFMIKAFLAKSFLSSCFLNKYFLSYKYLKDFLNSILGKGDSNGI